MKIRKTAQSAGIIGNVVDNLNSTSALDALSAKQGNELKTMIENINIDNSGSGTSTTAIIEVDTLPEITEENKTQILKYQGQLYYVKPGLIWRNIQLGDNLAGAKLKAEYPKVGQQATDVLGYYWLDNTSAAQEVITYIETDGLYGVNYWRGGANRTYEYLEIDDKTVYEMDGGSCITNTINNGITCSTNMGTVTYIQNKESKLYQLLYIQVLGQEWAPIGVDEIAISTEEPGEEKNIWIDPNEELQLEDVKISRDIITVGLTQGYDYTIEEGGVKTKVDLDKLCCQLGNRMSFNATTGLIDVTNVKHALVNAVVELWPISELIDEDTGEQIQMLTQLRISKNEQMSGEDSYVTIASQMVSGSSEASKMYTLSTGTVLVDLTNVNNLSLQIYNGKPCTYRVKSNRSFFTVEAID